MRIFLDEKKLSQWSDSDKEYCDPSIKLQHIIEILNFCMSVYVLKQVPSYLFAVFCFEAPEMFCGEQNT